MKKHTAMTPLLPKRSAAMGTPNLVRVLSTDITTKIPAAEPLAKPPPPGVEFRAQCPGCGNDTFHAIMEHLSDKTFRIVMMICAICDERVHFNMTH